MKAKEKLDLSNVTITVTDIPSTESEIIDRYWTIKKFREFNLKMDDFMAMHQKAYIKQYEALKEEERENVFKALQEEFENL